MSRLSLSRARPAAVAGTAEEPAITTEGLTKSYGAVSVLRGLDLVVPTGSITAVLGSSGSGKTTLLRLIAGFETADAGRISMTGRVIDDGRSALRPQHRGIGYVPQDGALFPHLTVRANIAFGLRRRDRARAAGLEEMVGLGGLSRRYPHQLSGGQQQRVALARALAINPAVVLLDEPFGSLDVHLRADLRAEVLGILRAANATTVLVTHDQDEALSVADHLAVIEAGRLLAHGRPRDLYERPPTPRVATAIGTANILPGRLHAGNVHCAVGEFAVPTARAEHSTDCLVMVRPENLHLGATVTAGRPSATVTGLAYHGHDTMIDLRLNAPGFPMLIARVSATTPPPLGATVALATVGQPHIWVQGTGEARG